MFASLLTPGDSLTPGDRAHLTLNDYPSITHHSSSQTMENYLKVASTVIDLGNDESAAVVGEGGAGGGGGGGGSVAGVGGGGSKTEDQCCGGKGDGHSHQKKISLDVLEEGKEAEFLFEAVKQG